MADDSLMRHIWWPYSYHSPTVFRSPQYTLISLSPRMTVFSISLISLVSCVLDKATADPVARSPFIQHHVNVLRDKLRDSFQAANLLLLLAAVMEWSSLLQIYVWFSMTFVVMGLIITIVQFLHYFQRHGVSAAILLTFPEVTFLFVLFRCLPLVVRYEEELEMF